MHLAAEQVAVSGQHGPLLAPTNLNASAGEVTVVAGDPGHGHVALALALGGRVARSSGTVTLDGDDTSSVRRRHVALVDVPDVTAPDEAVSVRAVLGEELALAGLPSGRGAVHRFLAERGLLDVAASRWEGVPSHVRTAWLMETAAAREAVRVLVVAHPDRHGGDPHRWWEVAQSFADRGLTVVVQCTHTTARQLGHFETYELGA